MPRLSPALIRQAKSENPLLTLLLRVCRDLHSARNELRWLQEHARDAVNAQRYATHGPATPHKDPGIETPRESSWPKIRRVNLDPPDSEDNHAPTQSTQQGLGIGKYFGGRRIRKINTELPSASNARRPNVRIRKHAVEETSIETKGLKPAFRKVNKQKDPTSGEKPEDLKVRYWTPADVSIRHLTCSAFKIRSWYHEGTHEVKLSTKIGETPSNAGLVGDAQAQKFLIKNVEKRSKGMPLQYILGNQPFGNLVILCQRRVLIPRPETEMYTEKAANLLLSALNTTDVSVEPRWQRRKKIRILDLCTGTGCIALLLHSILKPIGAKKLGSAPELDIEILGVDNNPKAVDLARKNLEYNISQKLLHPDAVHSVSFQNVDVLALAKKAYGDEGSVHQVRQALNAAAAGVSGEDATSFAPSASWDMVIANPPYIGPKDYELGGKTEPSVRDYEPKEALVPVSAGRFRSSSIVQADLFYWPLMRIARAVNAQLLVMEVGDSAQASRVYKGLLPSYSSSVDPGQPRTRIESWRDDGSVRILPTQTVLNSTFDKDFEEATDPEISDRAVIVWTEQMADWRRQTLLASDRKLDTPFIPDPATKEGKGALKLERGRGKEAQERMQQEVLLDQQHSQEKSFW